MKTLISAFCFLLCIVALATPPAVLIKQMIAPASGGGGGGILEVASQRATGHIDGTTSPTVIVFPNSVTSGNLVIVGGAFYCEGVGPFDIVPSDSRVSSWTVKKYVLDTDGTTYAEWIFVAFGVASSSGVDTVSVTASGTITAMNTAISIDEFTGQNASPFSVDGTGTTGSGSQVSRSITTANTGELIVSSMNYGGGTDNTTIAASSGWTLIGAIADRTYETGGLCFRIATTATSYNNEFTLGDATRSWYCQAISFKP